MFRFRLLAAALLLGLTTSAVAQTRPAVPNPSSDVLKTQFTARLEDAARRVDGVVSYCVIDLTSGDRFTRLDLNVQPTASTIKLAVLYELVKQAEEGRLSLDAARTVDRQKVVGGAGILNILGTPTMSLRDFATLMIVLSDNSAANLVIDAVGLDAVTARMRALGLTSTRLRRRMMDGAAARRGDENVSTAAEIARLLEIFERGEGLKPQSRDEALRILKIRNDSRVSWVMKGVPETIDVACKEGDLEGVRVDAGIVYAKNRPYIVSVMATYLQDDAAGERAIEEISRVAYEYFSRLGAGSEYGRQLGR